MRKSRIVSLFASIRGRFIMAYMVIMVVLLAFFNLSIMNLIEQSLVNRRVNELRVQVETVSANVAPQFAAYDAAGVYAYVRRESEQNDARIVVADEDGIVQVDAFSQINATSLWQEEVVDVLQGSEFSYGFHRELLSDQEEKQQEQWLIYCVAPMIYDGARIGVVLYSTSIQDVVDMLTLMSDKMQVNAVGIGALVIILSFFIATFMLNPIEDLTQAIETMSMERVVHPVAVETSGHSELARLAAAFNNMTQKLEATDQARNEFVSNASHELKTPLSSMKVLTESLLHSEHFDESLTREFLQDIDNEIDRLSVLVSDLLLLTQMDKQSTVFHFEPVSLADVVERALKNLVPLAKGRDIVMDADINDECVVSGDAMRLFQMVTNLTDNAIKYTPKGGHVRVILNAYADEAVLRVRDNGIGIPADAVDHIFERFYRVDKARAREAGGTGLGLSIVYQIVDMHAGTIEVDSIEAKGTTFTVRLPLSRSQSEKEESQNHTTVQEEVLQ